MCVKLFYISLNECESSTTTKLGICSYTTIELKNIITLDNNRHLAGYVSTNKCANIVRCSFYIFKLNRSINSKWQLLGYATIEFSEQCKLRPL
jgi:hypothetical protein